MSPAPSQDFQPRTLPAARHCFRMAGTLALFLLLVLAVAGAPTVLAGANPSVNWTIVYSPFNANDADAQILASKFDFMEVEPGNEDWPQYIRRYNPNFKFVRYDNFTNNNRGGQRDKWTALQNACAALGQDFERMWLHFSTDTKVALNNDTPLDDRLGGAVGEGVVMFSGGYLTDQSYWAYGSDPGTNVAFLQGASDIVYMGYFDRFAMVDVSLKQAASADFAAVWEYLRSDSVWAALSVNDSTFGMRQSGHVRFTPPTNWGFLSVDGTREYWLRLRNTRTPATAPRWGYLRKEKFYPPKNADNTFTVPGWAAANDANGDGWVSDAEFAARPVPGASARFKSQARIPTFYWVSERYAANVGDALYRQLCADWVHWKVTTPVAGGQYLDGIYEDNCIPSDGSITVMGGVGNLADSIFVGSYGFTSGGSVLEYPGAGPGRRFHQDHLVCDSTVYARLKSAGKWLQGNSSQFYGDSHLQQFDPQAVRGIVRGDSGGYFAYSVHHMVQRETWAIPKTTISSGGLESPTVCASAQFRYAREQTSNGRMGEFLVRQSYANADYGPATITKERDRMFGLAYFCMIANPNAYCGWMSVEGITPAESTQWWPAVGYNFGTPQNDSVYTFQTGTDSNGEPYTVYARYFTNALVLVKPKPYWNSKFSDNESPITTANLPVALRRLNYDGTLGSSVTQVALRNIEGAVLVGSVSLPGGGSPPPPPVDTTPPGAVTDKSALFRVMSVSPGSLSVATRRTLIKVDVSENVDPTSVGTNTVQATGSTSGAHAGRLSAVGRYLTFTPDVPFTAGETVTARVLGTLRSASGRTLDGDGNGTPGGDKVWTFSVSDY
ncbi:MAG: Ig-like domain-containing protein [Candidatus Eisenbacteria bacterium]|nr:Ig-like domain-containing protein [Candidatus Eisenbacteria bacterium]